MKSTLISLSILALLNFKLGASTNNLEIDFVSEDAESSFVHVIGENKIRILPKIRTEVVVQPLIANDGTEIGGNVYINLLASRSRNLVYPLDVQELVAANDYQAVEEDQLLGEKGSCAFKKGTFRPNKNLDSVISTNAPICVFSYTALTVKNPNWRRIAEQYKTYAANDELVSRNIFPVKFSLVKITKKDISLEDITKQYRDLSVSSSDELTTFFNLGFSVAKSDQMEEFLMLSKNEKTTFMNSVVNGLFDRSDRVLTLKNKPMTSFNFTKKEFLKEITHVF